METGHYKHKERQDLFGHVYNRGESLLFQRVKYVEVNKTKSAPKVCVQAESEKLGTNEMFEKGIIREVGSDFLDVFEKITFEEFCELDMIAFNKV